MSVRAYAEHARKMATAEHTSECAVRRERWLRDALAEQRGARRRDDERETQA